MTSMPSASERGRPCLPDESRRSRRVVMMITADEYARLKRLSSRREQSISATCRDLILKEFARPEIEQAKLHE